MCSPLLCLLGMALSLIPCCSGSPIVGTAEIVATEPVVDLAKSSQTISTRNCELTLELTGLLPGKTANRQDVAGNISVIEGVWQTGGAGPVSAPSDFTLDGGGLRLTHDQLQGDLKLVARSHPQTELICTLDGRIKPWTDWGRSVEPEPITGMRFWTIKPRTQQPDWIMEGTYKATVEGQPVTGKLTGVFTVPVREGFWSLGRFDNGLKLNFDMGRARVNWNHVRLTQLSFNPARDWSKHTGLQITVVTDQPREDVSVSVWIGEADGSWYYIKSAVPLADRENTAMLLFDDFTEAEWVAPGSHMDEDYALDLKSVGGMAIGVVNPLGVGKVSFVVKQIDLVRCRPVDHAPAQVVVTGKTISVNKQEFVPAGIFGGYAPDLPQDVRPGCQRRLWAGTRPTIPEKGEQFIIDCYSDRKVPATLLTDPKWREALGKYAQQFAENSKTTGYVAHFEFWNEPYLNWAERSRVNLASQFFRTDLARENGPVQVSYVDGPVIPHFKWVRGDDGRLKVVDETAFSYWAGAGNGWIYDQMLAVVGPTMKNTNPDVQVVLGWGFRWNEDHWAAWDLLYQPSIDRNIAWLDGVGEHHYQGDTVAMNGSYEVLSAYCMTRHNKWIYAYNTETGDLLDTPARGAVDTPEKAKAATTYRRAIYNLRDCLYSVYQSSDKLRARTVIHNDADGKPIGENQKHTWTHVAFGMMSNLRGRLVETGSDDDDVWVVASVDGTDPQAMPPPGTPQALVVMVFNNHRNARSMNLSIHAPDGTTFDGGVIELPTVDAATYRIGLNRTEVKVVGTKTVQSLTLPGRAAWKISLPLVGTIANKPQIQRSQFFSPEILQQVRRSKEITTFIQLEPATLANAKRAWLRLVVEDVAPGEAIVKAGETVFTLPKAYTADNVNKIQMLPLDPSKLEKTVPVKLKVASGNHDGYRVDALSIFIEH